jgi:hypothetical protein
MVMVLKIINDLTYHLIFFVDVPFAQNLIIHSLLNIVKLHSSDFSYNFLICLLLLMPLALSSVLKLLNSFGQHRSCLPLLMFR